MKYKISHVGGYYDILAEVNLQTGEVVSTKTGCKSKFRLADFEKSPNWVVKPLKEKDDEMPNSALDKQVGGNHYKDLGMQPLEVMQSILTETEYIGFLKGNLIKYSIRQGRKEGSDDAAKAKHYQELLEEYLG